MVLQYCPPGPENHVCENAIDVHTPNNNNNNNPWNSLNVSRSTSFWKYAVLSLKFILNQHDLMQMLDSVKNILECFLTLDKEGHAGSGKRLMPSEPRWDPLLVKPLIIPAVWFKRRHTKTRQSDECHVYGASHPCRR